MTTRGVFTSPDSIASFNPKSLTIQPKSVSSELFFPDGANGVAEKCPSSEFLRHRARQNKGGSGASVG
jgi:hypothetical protein